MDGIKLEQVLPKEIEKRSFEIIIPDGQRTIGGSS